MRRRASDPPEQGDLIQVEWVDISEDSTGDPSDAELSRRTSFGIFWGERDSFGLPCVVTTTTLDSDNMQGQQGYCIYPKACILKITVVKRTRKHEHRSTTKGTV